MRRGNLFAYFLVLGLAACGGGGGGGGGTSPAGSSGGGAAGGGGGGSSAGTGTTATRNPIPEQVALNFTAATTPATISATSASRLMSDTVTGSRLAQAIGSEQLALIGQSSALTGAAVNRTIPCDTGSITISGNTNNAGAGSLAVDFVDCRKGTDTLNGPATLTITTYDSANKIIRDSTLNFVRVHYTGPGIDSDISGTQRTVVSSTAASWCNSSGCATETMTQNITFLIREGTTTAPTSRMARSRLTVTNQYESVNAPTFFTQRLAGNVDDDQLGSVSVGTATAAYTGPWGDLYYSTRFQPFPDWGIVRIDGAANSTARASSMGIALAKIEVDAGGDGTFENNARMPWIALATPSGANLNDSDHDGMHDSWETTYGLLPNQNDAANDNDNDGYSNLTEYLVGSDPSTSGSIPADVRHLWVTNLSGIAYDTTNPANPVFNVFVGGSGDGVQLDTVTRELATTPFTGGTVPPAGGLTVTDATGTYTLAPTASPTVWTLSSSNGTSITIDSVGGTNPTSLIRYGARGLAFRTQGAAPAGSSAGGGYIYLIESRTLIP